MDRRKFLFQSASFLCGSILGLNGPARAFASQGRKIHSPESPRIALIIDDIGFSRVRAKEFLELGIPITFSILPRLKKSRELAMEIHEMGHEIMLHQPMEPYNPEIDPGPGALYAGFSPNRIDHVLEENIYSVPYATGVNNHMGSKFTACQKGVEEALKVINRAGYFFVDSLTTSRSTAYKTARRMHMPSARRNRFLDNIPDESAIVCQLHKLVRHGFRYGHAIGIGHPYPETVRALGRFSDNFKRYGVSLVHVSRVLRPGPGAADKGKLLKSTTTQS